MSHASILSPVNLPLPSARPVPRPSRSDGWNVLADIEVFIFAVEAELEAMDRERVGVHRRGCKPDLSLRRRVIGLIWMLTFGGMQGASLGCSRVFPSPRCTPASPAGLAEGCGAGWASASLLIGGWPAATRCCPRR
jgi:hypothetical protein